MKSRKKKGLLIVLAVLAALLILAALAGVFIFQHYYSKLSVELPTAQPSITPPAVTPETDLSEEEILSIDEQLRKSLEAGSDRDYSSKDVTNILLIGVDNDNLAGMNSLGNADGLIIASINRKTEQVVLTSIMRDTYVSVPDSFNTKITLAYHYGGVPMLLDTVEANFGIPIDNYVLVNYLDVVQIVDAMGGVPMDVYGLELYYMQDKIENINRLLGRPVDDSMVSREQEGRLTLNGVQAAAYMRVRMAGNNDFERTERARKVVMALKDKAVTLSFSELNTLAETVLPCITTDLSQGEILSLLIHALDYMKYDIISSRIPIDDSFYFANLYGSVLVMDYEENREYLYNSIYEGSLAP